VIVVLTAGVLLTQVIGPPPQPLRADSLPIPVAVRNARALGTRTGSGMPGPKYWQIWPEYELFARLDPLQAVVAGRGTLSFINASPDTLQDIVLRLDQNRFRVASSPVRTRGIALRRLHVDGVAMDLASPAISGLTTTVVRVRVPHPIAPRSRVNVSFEWDFEVPLDENRQALRQGRWGQQVYQIAQWYPRLAMYDDLGGWDQTPHDGSREFFNPFGRFRVQLQVPANWIVGATGTLTNAADVLGPTALGRLAAAAKSDTTVDVIDSSGLLHAQSEEQNWRFDADSVSDFAWGASTQYSWTVTSRSTQAGRVVVNALYTKPQRAALVSASHQTADAIARLSQLLMPYAWGFHTLVDGPEGGMEYPALTMSNGDVINHEVGHQWFPMMVGTDETRFDFLDEGFATYLAGVLSGVSGRTVLPVGAVEPLLANDDLRTVRFVLGYVRGSSMLQALAARTNEERLWRSLSAYARQWRFKHPSPWDFMASMEASLGEDLADFWVQWLFNGRSR
jgi:hypothetical protein